LTGAYDDGNLVLETHADLGENSTNDTYAALGSLADWVTDGAITPIVSFASARLPSVMQALFENLRIFKTYGPNAMVMTENPYRADA
jgi:hypothetical protein